ncbi:hypothetical protein BH11MYX3_BH11MYX3_32620 [soil metagenome]
MPSDLELAIRLDAGGVVLSFRELPVTERDALLVRLRGSFPEHSTFASAPTWITILPVVARSRVLERATEIRAAIADFLTTRRELIDHYRRGTLDPQWDTSEHGADCTFEHFGTGQVVEAPLWADHGQLDPMFFAMFVRSTPQHARVAELLVRDFHDAARILELVR